MVPTSKWVDLIGFFSAKVIWTRDVDGLINWKNTCMDGCNQKSDRREPIGARPLGQQPRKKIGDMYLI